jgi:beta-galactosidase
MVVDDKGRPCPTADNDVAFSVSEGAKVIGVGNGNPSSAEPDKASARRAFNGKCLAIVAVGEKSGTVTVSAASPSLRTGTVELHVQPAPTRPSIP